MPSVRRGAMRAALGLLALLTPAALTAQRAGILPAPARARTAILSPTAAAAILPLARPRAKAAVLPALPGPLPPLRRNIPRTAAAGREPASLAALPATPADSPAALADAPEAAGLESLGPSIFDGGRRSPVGGSGSPGSLQRLLRAPHKPGGSVKVGRLPTDITPGFIDGGKKKGAKALAKEHEALDELAVKLYAEKSRAVLIVFQAMDTAGKDGAIRKVFGPLDSRMVEVSDFKAPTPEEAAHDFLWRVHPKVPKKGKIGIFNRSHYEDVIMPVILGTHGRREVRKRYRQINDFERHLTDNGVVIIKFFLNISKEEQKARLQARLDDPEKTWKFDPRDLEARKKWDEYMKLYGKLIARTSTPWAPWYVIPADRKWYRNVAVARIVRRHLEKLDPRFPEPAIDPKAIVIPD